MRSIQRSRSRQPASARSIASTSCRSTDMFSKAMPLRELWDGDMHACNVDGRKVLLIRNGDHVYAYEDRCAHLGLPLSDGYLHGCRLNPRNKHLTPFAVRVEDGVILVDVCPEIPETSHG